MQEVRICQICSTPIQGKLQDLRNHTRSHSLIALRNNQKYLESIGAKESLEKLVKEKRRLEKLERRKRERENPQYEVGRLKLELARLTQTLSKVKVKRFKLKDSEKFYSSPGWQSVRFQVLATHVNLYGRCCVLCGMQSKELHVDHIIPRSINRTLELDVNNLQVLCADCNIGKSNKDTTDFRNKESPLVK